MERQSAARESPILDTVFPSVEQFSPKTERRKEEEKKQEGKKDRFGWMTELFTKIAG